MELNKFLIWYRLDSAGWHMLSSKDTKNLFDEAVAVINSLQAQIAAVRQALGGALTEIDRLRDGLQCVADGEWNADPEWYAQELLNSME